MNIVDFKGDWALVTGASCGIGAEFALQLAAAGMNVVLVARSEDKLEALAAALREQHGVKTLVIGADLVLADATDTLKARLATEGIRIRLLCNNAGRGRWGRFEHTTLADYQEIMILNTTVVVTMCHAFLADLASFPSSAVINVASTAVFQPVPFMGVYAASKTFVHSYSQALHGEWAARGILVQSLLPGPTDTGFDAKALAYPTKLIKRARPSTVVAASLTALRSGAPVVIASRQNTLVQRLFGAMAPRRMVIREVAKMFTPPV
jgi:short-subunit dehydrogenase